ncbi:MAG: hypothetical protein KKC43_05475 [Alphaproteobacteria bacterium]|nr:hypothetical protein [Alphaproteobacteria bacterium]
MKRTLKTLGTAILIGSVGLPVAGCAYPTTETVQGGESSAIYFQSFPADAVVMVDGQSAGTVGDFDGGANTLAVLPGTHEVVISQNGTVIHNKTVFVGRNSALKISR